MSGLDLRPDRLTRMLCEVAGVPAPVKPPKPLPFTLGEAGLAQMVCWRCKRLLPAHLASYWVWADGIRTVTREVLQVEEGTGAVTRQVFTLHVPRHADGHLCYACAKVLGAKERRAPAVLTC